MTKLIKYDAACRAIAEARRVDDVKTIKDKAEAMRAYGRQIKNPQLEADAWEIRKRAEDKLGELSAALEQAHKVGKGKGSIRLPSSGKLKAASLKAAGISTSAAHRYEEFHRLSAGEKERRIARGRAAIEAGKSIADVIITQGDKKERRAEREQQLGAKQKAMPTKIYGVIYADPPWRFQVYSEDTGMDRAADNHYPTMDLAAINALEVPAAPDCVLFLWATVPMLPEALTVMSTWGFTYKSNFAWRKDKAGTGFWNKNKHELLLIGTRGNIPAPAPGDQFESVIEAPRGEHSTKPFSFREMIEEMFPTLPRIELFARERFAGWDVWGYEAPAEAAA
jgi:N6-adenosine-specific RNA methylase IME4